MRKKGFTLIEVLIVLVTIGILVAIAIPSLRNSLKKANVTRVISNMRTLNYALQQYSIENNGWPKTLHVNTFEPLISYGYLKMSQVTAICKPLLEERLGAYVIYQGNFLIFFKMKIFPKVQFYLFPDGVYIKNPMTNKVEKFEDMHMRILIGL